MIPKSQPLTMYGRPSSVARLDWSWVNAQLAQAGTYWVTAHGAGHPHPRPVWGVWYDEQLHLSIGSPGVARLLASDPTMTVNLPSGVDVVIVEGHATGFAEAPHLYELYDDKYDWNYTIEEYGRLTTVTPTRVMAWRSAGWAGRDGFQEAGRWVFDTSR